MDLSLSNDSFHYLMSEFGILMSISKSKLRNVQSNIKIAMDNINQEENDPKSQTRNSWLIDLDNKLTEIEIAGRITWLRPFMYLTNNLETHKRPDKEKVEENVKMDIPTYDITLSDADLEPSNISSALKKICKCSKTSKETTQRTKLQILRKSNNQFYVHEINNL